MLTSKKPSSLSLVGREARACDWRFADGHHSLENSMLPTKKPSSLSPVGRRSEPATDDLQMDISGEQCATKLKDCPHCHWWGGRSGPMNVSYRRISLENSMLPTKKPSSLSLVGRKAWARDWWFTDEHLWRTVCYQTNKPSSLSLMGRKARAHDWIPHWFHILIISVESVCLLNVYYNIIATGQNKQKR